MGEIIRVVSKGRIKKQEFEIELNKPQVKGHKNIIHIQSNDFRFEVSEKEFIQIAVTILSSIQRLKGLKNIEDD